MTGGGCLNSLFEQPGALPAITLQTVFTAYYRYSAEKI